MPCETSWEKSSSDAPVVVNLTFAHLSVARTQPDQHPACQEHYAAADEQLKHIAFGIAQADNDRYHHKRSLYKEQEPQHL